MGNKFATRQVLLGGVSAVALSCVVGVGSSHAADIEMTGDNAGARTEVGTVDGDNILNANIADFGKVSSP